MKSAIGTLIILRPSDLRLSLRGLPKQRPFFPARVTGIIACPHGRPARCYFFSRYSLKLLVRPFVIVYCPLTIAGATGFEIQVVAGRFVA